MYHSFRIHTGSPWNHEEFPSLIIRFKKIAPRGICIAFTHPTCDFMLFSGLVSILSISQAPPAPAPLHANCVLVPVDPSPTTEKAYEMGILEFQQTTLIDEKGTFTYVAIRGVVPNQPNGTSRGVHIHSFGDLSDRVGGTSAGPHYNPLDSQHGCYPDPERKLGDLGNFVTVDPEAGGRFEADSNALIRLEGTHSVIGRAIVVHADVDNCEHTPAGDSSAGARKAFCVIGMTDPGEPGHVLLREAWARPALPAALFNPALARRS